MGEFVARWSILGWSVAASPMDRPAAWQRVGRILQCHMGCPGARTAKAGGRFRDGARRPCAGGRQPPSLAHSARALKRAGHRVDHAPGQKIDGAFAAKLIARAAFDQPRSEAALHGCDDRRAAGLGPDQSQFRPGVKDFRREGFRAEGFQVREAPRLLSVIAA
jgi:hypothetical protein